MNQLGYYLRGNDITNTNSNGFDLGCNCPTEQTHVIISNATKAQQHKISRLSTEISTSEDVETLLDHVNWKMFIYSCEQTCSNFSYSEYDFEDNCSDSSCCFTNSIDNVLTTISNCGNVSCTSFINSFPIISTWWIFLLLGILCLLGNVTVVYQKVKRLHKSHYKDKEIQIYDSLVLNLALADLLMGIYLTAISFELKHKVAFDEYFSESRLCTALAVINAVSIQVSLTILFIISTYRLIGLIRPYKRQHLKSVATLIILTWAIWLFVAILPILPFETFETAFTFGLVKDYIIGNHTLIDFAYTTTFLQTNILPKFEKVSEVSSILNAVTRFPTPRVLKKFSTSVGWIESETAKSWSLIGFYNIHYSCSINFFVTSENYRHSNDLILAYVFYNLIISVAIMITYSAITLKVCEKYRMRFEHCKCSFSFFCCKRLFNNTVLFQGAKAVRSAENRKIFKRISFIVLTNLLCWIPLCIASLVVWHYPTTIVHNFNALFSTWIPFPIVMLTIVPFNSILNPYIYSCHLWKRLLRKIKSKF